jgi:hypothetical protein
MQIVPLQPVPNQTSQIVLASQNCQLNVYQAPAGIFMDVLVNDEPIVTGVICQNKNRIVRSLYLGFSGDLVFQDLQPDPVLGPQDPSYSGLGSRFQLVYLSATDLPTGEG